MSRICVLAAVGTAAAMTTAALADVTAIGAFAGEAYETFEAIGSPAGYPGPLGIFGGNATLNDSLANTVVIAFNWMGPAGEIIPLNGNLMGGVPAGAAVFEFSTAVTDFGGYISTVAAVGGGTAVFWDAEGAQIGSMSFDATPADWTWIGWHSDTGISRIELTGNVPGFGFQFDDLTLNYVPAPASAGLLALAAGALARRRRA